MSCKKRPLQSRVRRLSFLRLEKFAMTLRLFETIYGS